MVVSISAIFNGAWAAEADTAVVVPAAAAESGKTGDSDLKDSVVVVTGVRGGNRTVLNSASPIDIVSAKQLQTSGKTGLKELLTTLLPSFNLPGVNGGGTSWTVRATTLRGLQGDQVLYLVNGKRRHNTALINNLARIGNGGVPVDIDLIPVAAIDHIEVLRDGAAAQYGSDAIGGVINIILKNSDSGGSASISGGQNYDGDGATGHASADFGTKLGTDGFAHFALDYKNNTPWDRAQDSKVPQLYNPLPNGQPDPRNATANRQQWGTSYGQGRDPIISGSYNLELPIDGVTLYSFSTLSHRDSFKVTGTFLPNNLNALPQVYPNGFNAQREIDETDFQFAGGVRGQVQDWKWDLSTTYGEDNAKLGALNTLNASLGPSSPTTFNLTSQIYDQWTNNLDVSRQINTGLFATPLTLSLGAEARWERYQIKAGDLASYVVGNYVIPSGVYAGLHPQPGLASYVGTSPNDAGSVSRTNTAAYIDLSQSITDKWSLAAAARAEHYSDSAGNTASGKLSTRYEFLPGYAVRATVGNGFRAPSLAQNIYASSTFTGSVTSTGYQIFPVKVLPPNSPEAKALGAEPLTPEKSINYSVGFTAQPVNNLRISLDAYQISIKDRIVQTTLLTGPTVSGVLVANGFTAGQSAQYYTNAVDTQTRGIDLVGDYTTGFGDYGVVKWSTGFSYVKTEIEKLKATPTVLSNIGYDLFGHQQQSDLTKGTPNTKLLLGANWSIDRFNTSLRFTRYGSYTEAAPQAANDRDFKAKWITDLDVAYKLTPSVTVALGANNLLNVFPTKNGIVDQKTGINQYGLLGPFGIAGGYYYGRLDYKF
jgi:iron complex outermembrane receptor protein